MVVLQVHRFGSRLPHTSIESLRFFFSDSDLALTASQVWHTGSTKVENALEGFIKLSKAQDNTLLKAGSIASMICVGLITDRALAHGIITSPVGCFWQHASAQDLESSKRLKGVGSKSS